MGTSKREIEPIPEADVLRKVRNRECASAGTPKLYCGGAAAVAGGTVLLPTKMWGSTGRRARA